MRLWASRLTKSQPDFSGRNAEGSDGTANHVAPGESASSKPAAAAMQRPGVPGLLYTSPERTKLATQSMVNSLKPAANLFGSALPLRRPPS